MVLLQLVTVPQTPLLGGGLTIRNRRRPSSLCFPLRLRGSRARGASSTEGEGLAWAASSVELLTGLALLIEFRERA